MTTHRLKWPFPGDSALDRSRRIARSYRTELYAVDPDRCIELDNKARLLGEGWVAPEQAVFTVDDMLTAPQIAEILGVQPATVRQWGARHLVKRHTTLDGRTVYRLGDVIDYQADQRRRRAEQKAS